MPHDHHRWRLPMTTTLLRPMKGLTFLLLLLAFAAPALAAEGVEVGKIAVHPPVPGYVGESLKEMIATELLSSTAVPACQSGERCRWRLDGEIKKDEGFDITLHLIETETGRDAGELELRAASEADLPGAVASLAPRLAQLMKRSDQKELGAPSIDETAPEPPSRLHPDRLAAEMEAGKIKAHGRTAPVTTPPPQRSQAAPAPDDQEDDSAYVPDYPIPDGRLANRGQSSIGPSAQGAQAKEEHSWRSLIGWPLGLFHGEKGRNRDSEGASSVSKPKEVQTAAPLSTPPYPTPDEVFAPRRVEPMAVDNGEIEAPVWKRVLGWPLKLFTRSDAVGDEVGRAPQNGLAEEKKPSAATSAPTAPPTEPKKALPEAPGVKGPIWQWR